MNATFRLTDAELQSHEANVTVRDPSETGRLSCGSISAPRWFAVEAEFKKLNSANHELLDRGFETYVDQTLDRIRETVRGKQNGHYSWVARPSFFHFFFVRFDLNADPWHRARGAPGVKRLLTAPGGVPQPVGHGVVEHMVQTQQDRLRLPPKRLPAIKPGAMVLIREEGPFSGMVGEVESCNGYTTVVWLSFLGRAKKSFMRVDLSDE